MGTQRHSDPKASPQDAEATGDNAPAGGLQSRPILEKATVSFHGACSYGNQTSAAGLQQRQERQAPFLSPSQEPNWRGQREEGTIGLSELGRGWGQGEGEVVFLFNGPAINYLNVAPYFTPLCLRSHYSHPGKPPSNPVSLEPSQLSFVPRFLPADPSRGNQPPSLLATHSPPPAHIPSMSGSPKSSRRMMVVVRVHALKFKRPEFKSQLCH